MRARQCVFVPKKVGGVTWKLTAMRCTKEGLDGMMSSGIAKREADWERASPPLLSRATHLLSGTIHAELHAPPFARPHLPSPVNPDLSHEGDKVGVRAYHWEKKKRTPKYIFFWK